MVIDGTTHSTKYYDYIDDNNAATITARAGTGEADPGAPSNLSVTSTPFGNILVWWPVEKLNGFAVTHYEVGYAEGGWEVLKSDVGGIVYLDITDTASNRVNRAYRVRAVNIFGVPGPWAAPSASGGRRRRPARRPTSGRHWSPTRTLN